MTNRTSKIFTRLLSIILIMSIIPFSIIGFIAFDNTQKTIKSLAFDQLKKLRQANKSKLDNFFLEQQHNMDELVDTIAVLKQSSFDKFAIVQENKKAQIQEYFQNVTTNISVISGDYTIRRALVDFSSTLNEDGSFDLKLYNFFEKVKYGSSLNRFKSSYGYYDILLINKKGNIVYSINREKDLGQNVLSEPLIGSGLGKCFKLAVHKKNIQDFEPYSPTGNKLLAFIGNPIEDKDGNFLGVAVIKIDNTAISIISQRSQGMGKTGKTYLIGEYNGQTSLRSSSVLSQSTLDQISSNKFINQSMYGSLGPIIRENHNNVQEIVVYDKLDIPGLNWVLITRMSLEEVIVPIVGTEINSVTQEELSEFQKNNLYLISRSGNVFYAKYHDAVYGTNLLTGKFSGSGLARSFRSALSSKSFEFIDFDPFPPAGNKPRAFISKPLITENEIDLVVVKQFSPRVINSLLEDKSDTKESYDSYLVGPDKLMRSDSMVEPDDFSVEKAFAEPDKKRLSTVASLDALAGITGERIILDYRNIEVLCAYMPIDAWGVTWALITEIDTREAFVGLQAFKLKALLIAILSVIAIVLVSYLLSRRFALPISQLTESAEIVRNRNYNIKVDIQTGDELELLADTFNEMVLEIKGHSEEMQQKIKQLKQAEKAMRESEERHRTILQTAMDGFWLVDIKGVLLEVNESYCRMSGYEVGEIQGKNISELEAMETMDDISSHLKKTRLQSEDRFESQHYRKDGTLFDVEVSVQYRPIKDGQYVVFLRDITERKLNEQALQRSSERLKLALNAAHAGTWEWDLKTGENFWSDELWSLYFLSPETGKPSYDLWLQSIHPDDRDRVRSKVKAVTSCGEELDIEWRVKGYDGQEHWLMSRGKPLQDKNGQVIRYLGIVIDITDRKQVELALQESEEKFRNFTEQSFVGFYIIQDGRFKYVNPKFAEIFGYTIEECLDDIQMIDLVHEEDRAFVQQQVQKRIDGKTRAAQYTCRGIKKTGEIIHLSIYGSSLIYKEKPAAIGTMLDITKELEMEKRVAQSQRMESIGSLAGGIAHDFNNILFPIVGMAELLIEDLPIGSLERENAEEIYNAGRRGSDLVKQILAFSRRSEHKKSPVRIQQVLQEVLRLGRSTIPSNINLAQDIQSNCGLVVADSTQIHQVAMNLITNAYHAIEPDNGNISVTLREIELGSADLKDDQMDGDLVPGRYALLKVTDTGRGIEPAIMGKIFEPYFTTKEQGKGTGLGLAVAYGIVKDHNGDIKVYSELGKGTTINVYLPIMAKHVKPISIEIAKYYPTGNERILLVDDEASILRLEKQILERLGYTVDDYTSSVDALNAFTANPHSFDLVISDMTMPNMTGDIFSRKLISIRPDIPVIICTGFSERINDEKAASMGIKGFLMKPVVKTDLAKTIRQLLDYTPEKEEV